MSLISQVSAQDYRKFNVGVAFGYVSTTDYADGAVLHLEPSYMLSEQLALGMRLEVALLGKSIEGLETSVDGGDKSVTFNANYMFPGENFRFFAGVGVGFYRLASVEHPIAGFGTMESKLFLGGYPRMGLQYGRFNLIAEYNILPRSREVIAIQELTFLPLRRVVEINNSYFAIKAGILIGRDL